jgi:hypothetical protein
LVTRRPPPPTAQDLDRARRERHARWKASLSDRDWARILALAKEVTPLYVPARLDDLDAPGIAVGVCPVGHETRTSGERIGTVRAGQVAVLVWEK